EITLKNIKGVSEMAEAKTITFIITRQDRRDSAPYEETFKIPYRPNMNVISALMEIRKNPVNADGKKTNPIHWDMSCLEEVCGACSMVINGTARQSCAALVANLSQPIPFEPIHTSSIVRVLILHRESMFDALKQIKA